MINKLAKIIFSIKAIFFEYHFITRKDHKNFSSFEDQNIPAQITASLIDRKYVLKKKNQIIYLSTSIPYFEWQGHAERSPYYLQRIPVNSKNYSKEFNNNNQCTSGYSVSFISDSEIIYIEIQYKKILSNKSMPISSICGIDVYEDEEWLGCYTPDHIFTNKYNCKIKSKKAGVHKFKIYMPLFSQIQLITIGINKDFHLFSSPTSSNNAPIVVYGSSITQGCACSRPALCYTHQLSRILSCEVYNMGFSGSARGEEEIAQYINTLTISAIILEYDHNVDVKELEKTHYNFYSILRCGHPFIPIIMFSRTSGGLSISVEEEEIRYKIIKKTYIKAKKNNDQNIYLLRGNDFFEHKEFYFVDDRHPNDYGMTLISKKLLKIFLNNIF